MINCCSSIISSKMCCCWQLPVSVKALISRALMINASCCQNCLSRFLNKMISKDRKSTRLNSSHVSISYAVFCLKKKKKKNRNIKTNIDKKEDKVYETE